jgi:hypothetical protein
MVAADVACAPRRWCVFASRGRSRSITGRAGTLVVPLRRGQTAAGAVLNQGTRMSVGLPIARLADVHYLREAAIRLVACTTMCLMPILANAAQTDAQTPSDPQAYCVNRSADFYPYTGEPCESGYQLGSGNCRTTDGRMVAVPTEQCVAMAGTIELPFEPRLEPRRLRQDPKSMK